MKKYQIDGITENNIKQCVRFNLFNPIYASSKEQARECFETRLKGFYQLFNFYEIEPLHEVINWLNGSD